MKKPRISIIVAMDKKRGIGHSNKLPWYIPEELKRFKSLTTGHVVLMGRKTFESIINRLGKPLPERISVVVTRDKNYKPNISVEHQKQVVVCHSLEEALDKAKALEKNEVFIAGGGQIYEQSIKYADRLYLTLVEGEFEADTFFPDYKEFKKVVSKEEGQSDNFRYTFLTLDR